jgi:hypothetical protein
MINMMTYATPILQSVAATHIQKLQVLQNKMIKMALNVPFFTSTKSPTSKQSKNSLQNQQKNSTREKPSINNNAK